jgi:hypothetical protein
VQTAIPRQFSTEFNQKNSRMNEKQKSNKKLKKSFWKLFVRFTQKVSFLSTVGGVFSWCEYRDSLNWHLIK